MERKHFLTLGAGLTVGGLIGKSALNGEKISGAKTKISDLKFDLEKPFPISPEGDVNHPEQDGPYWDFIRTLFPLKSDLTFLNNGTMGITPYPVLEALNKSFHHIAENGAYPMHDGSFEENLGQILGCKGSELAITKNVSEGVNLACRAISLKKGDEVIITLHEHVGGCAAWLYRAKTEGIVLKLATLGATAEETLNNIKAVKTKNTKVIAVPHIPCTIGQVLPVNEICAWAKANGIISAIDGAHPLGMLQMNLKEMGCDYYSGCFHKWLLGPIGTGFFYASEEILSRSAIHHVAAYSVDKFDMSTTPPSMGELVNKTARYSYGTFPGPMYDGAKAAMQFYQKIGPALIEKRVKYLSKEVMTGLMEINNNPSLKFPVIDPSRSQNGVDNSSNNSLPIAWKMHHSQGPVIEILTPSEDASRGAQVGFRIHQHPSKIAAANIQSTIAETPLSKSKESQTGVPGTSTPQASQRFCDFARKNNVILRYVAENNIHCVRVSTHYYNNKKDINRFFEVLQLFLKEEGWM
jgi:selenocysteine lyase/cysteine desulfurase